MQEFNIPPGLTRKERRQFVRENRRQESHHNANKARIFKGTAFALLALLIILMSIWWFKRPAVPQDPLNEVISRNGLHWHSNLSISVDGQKQDISSGIGIGAVHLPMHTHDEKGTIHMEFQSRVKARDLQLGRFFNNWGKPFSSECIFDQCNGPGGSLKMRVNGKENTEFERYQMKDGDKIEIIYE